MKGKLLLIGLLVLAIALSGCTQPVACTEEAKLCPDGSSVARNPALNCEFDSCPTIECKKEGEAIPVIAEPPECCSGLILTPPKDSRIVGIRGYCCREQCLPPAPPYCPGGTVIAQDQTDNCNCPLPATCCGDDTCEGSETAENCPEDCGEEENLCGVGTEYEDNAINPVTCTCPEGYEFEVVSMGWGLCPPGEGISDCPASVLKCVEKTQ